MSPRDHGPHVYLDDPSRARPGRRHAEQPSTVLQVAPYAMGERRPFNRVVNLLTMPVRSVMSYAEFQT